MASDDVSAADPVPENPAPPRGPSIATLGRLLPLVACLGFGALISTLPHLIQWWQTGDPLWIADHDDVYYLSIGARARFDQTWKLTDPVKPGGFCPFRPLTVIPALILGGLLGLDPLQTGLISRLLAGLGMAGALYGLFRAGGLSRGLAAALAAWLMADPGTVRAQPLIAELGMSWQIVSGEATRLFQGIPRVQFLWRLLTPALSLPFQFAYLALIVAARRNPTPARTLAAGVGLGLLFHVYFYTWTSAVAGLALAWLVDPAGRRLYWRVGLIGAVLGFPAVAGDYLAKQGTPGDWLPRTDKFLPIDRFSELQIPRGAILLSILLGFWTLRRRREFVPIWALGTAALALLNHQVLTGLQIENFHYGPYVAYPTLVVLLALALAPLVRSIGNRGAWARWILGLLLLAQLVLGLGLRALEATRCTESRQLTDLAGQIRDDWPRLFGPNGPAPGTLLAGDRQFVELALLIGDVRPLSLHSARFSPSITDPEWEERLALESFLQGETPEAFAQNQRDMLDRDPWGPWQKGRDPDRLVRNRTVARRVQRFEAILADPEPFLNRYGIRYFVTRPEKSPMIDSRTRKLIANGRHWNLWELISPPVDPPGRASASPDVVR
jgi:hypothetical protein